MSATACTSKNACRRTALDWRGGTWAGERAMAY
jgi:hypothetical protein